LDEKTTTKVIYQPFTVDVLFSVATMHPWHSYAARRNQMLSAFSTARR